MNMQLVADGELMPLGQLEEGRLFRYGNCIALKSEYRNRSGEPECYIVGSGEMFWGGQTENLNALLVQPIAFMAVQEEGGST